MFKKITGLVLGIALFTMCPLTAAAAPMVPAPYTADQLVDLSRAALAGVSSYHVDSVESTEFTYPATPQANFFRTCEQTSLILAVEFLKHLKYTLVVEICVVVMHSVRI